LRNFLRYYKIDKVDGILGDLGISSHQIDNEERGFSYLGKTILDMRMNVGAGITAATVLNTYSEEALNEIFRMYGELKGYKNLTRLILKKREEKKFLETEGFIGAIDPFLPGFKKNKILSQIFQALRIEVNDEMSALEELLLQASDYLIVKGRLVIISYHSIEDRKVKNIMRTGNLDGSVEKDFYGNVSTPYKLINKAVILPSPEEIDENPRSRSAKLRVAEKI
jgi:16S rRNA (cytosine1402-N4)-methyltransferase